MSLLCCFKKQKTSSTCMVYNSAVSIFALPDELLIEIFVYVTHIATKIKLERVCRRFHSLSSQAKTWRGIHKLVMIMNCDKHGIEHHSFLSPSAKCYQKGYFINDINIDYVKWPTAVESLFKRTQIHQFSIHCGDGMDLYYFPTLFSILKEIFEQNQDKLRLEFVEFYFASLSKIIDQIQPFLIFSLEMSIPFLKEFRFVDGHVHKEYEFPIWPIIQKCNSLNVICYLHHRISGSMDHFALVGKPLKKVHISFYQLNIETLAEMLNGAQVESLYFGNIFPGLQFDLTQFADQFSEDSRSNLKFLTIRDDMNADSLKDLFMIPSMFPNVQSLKLIANFAFIIGSENAITEFCINLDRFFDVAHRGPTLQVTISRFSIDKTIFVYIEEQFKAELVNLCKKKQIQIYTGQDENSPLILLAKGNATVIITDIFDKHEQIQFIVPCAYCHCIAT